MPGQRFSYSLGQTFSTSTYKVTVRTSEKHVDKKCKQANLLYPGSEESLYRHSEVESKHSRSKSAHSRGRSTCGCIVFSTLTFVFGCSPGVRFIKGRRCRPFYIWIKHAHRVFVGAEHCKCITAMAGLDKIYIKSNCYGHRTRCKKMAELIWSREGILGKGRSSLRHAEGQPRRDPLSCERLWGNEVTTQTLILDTT